MKEKVEMNEELRRKFEEERSEKKLGNKKE